MPDMFSCRDMLQRVVKIPYPPQRIISVVPSQTELLYELGLEEQVIGITKFCVHPEAWFRGKTRIGGTKKLHLEKIASLNPELILANKEENTEGEIEWLSQRFPVWISDIQTIDAAFSMIEQVGLMTQTQERAKALKSELQRGFEALSRSPKRIRVAYFIWRQPWMSVGRDTFIHDIINRLGWQNVYEQEQRYPTTDLLQLSQLDAAYVLLSSEPYPFKDQHIAEIKAYLPNARVILVDGEMFSWYGSRMKLALPYFEALLRQISLNQ